MATIRRRKQRWHVQIRRAGFPTQTASFYSKDEAMKWARRQEALLDRGHGPERSVKRITLLDLIRRYEQEITSQKRSRKSELAHLKQIRVSFLATSQIDRIRPSDIGRWRDQRLKTVAPATVRKELTILGHIFAVAIREWDCVLFDNPVNAVKKPAAGRARTRRLSSSEWQKIEQALLQCRNPLMRDLTHMALATGMRRSEILSLKWANFDEKAGTLFLPLTKNGEPRFVPVSPVVAKILRRLRAHLDDDDVVSEFAIFPISPNALRMAWERLRKRAGVFDFRFHDLRHEAISRFFEMGLTVPEVALISGHKDPRMLFRYTHLRVSDLAQKLNHLAAQQGHLPSG